MATVKDLMENIHPTVATMVHRSLMTTFVNMVAQHAKDTAELEQLDRELGDEDFGTW